MQKPHVVILGAGASRACCPKGDRNGHELPLMSDFIEKVGLRKLFEEWKIDVTKNFEDIFSSLYENKKTFEISQLESIIENYFNTLLLPNMPTIYDHLVLSLRQTDVIATFNWDPLLVQAYQRNTQVGLKLPKLLFLHGNVQIGYCKKDGIKGILGRSCKKCSGFYEKSSLLYPIGKKDYASDFFISSEWKEFNSHIEKAFMITIFGYSAPKTDKEAISTMKKAWGESGSRNMEQIAFITKQNDEQIYQTWNNFIHEHHYEIQDSFYDSFIVKHPRRTGEAYLNQYVDGCYIDDNPIPQGLDFQSLWNWYEQFKTAEENIISE